MKIVHAADLHLDSPLCGLERYEGAPVERIRGATRRALENLVALCLGEDTALLLIAGDLYDGNWKDYSTGLFFGAQMTRLREAGIPVVMVRGNHDAESVITRHLRLPSNVRELSTRAPESFELDALGVIVHGQSYGQRAVTDDLASRYPEAVSGLLNIGLLHTAATGRAGHERYAPCHVETLINKGYDYWALGHVHTREVLAEAPWIVFPGNLQGRHAREMGCKGATVITVEDGQIMAVDHRSLDVVRFERCPVDASEANSAVDVIDLARLALEECLERSEGRTLAERVCIEGATRAHAELADDPERWLSELRQAATDAGGDALWVERVEFATRDVLDRDALAERDDALGQLVRSLTELRDDEAELDDLLDTFKELKRKLPHELRLGADGVRLDQRETIRDALDDVEQILLPRLLAAGQKS